VLHFLQQLFRRRDGAAAATWQPASEPTPEQARQYQAWVAEHVYQNWLGPYYKAYHLRKGGAGGQRGLRAELLREEGRQGALFFYHESIGPGNFQHLFQLLGTTAPATTAASATTSSTRKSPSSSSSSLTLPTALSAAAATSAMASSPST
jgi:hypothetical protein